MKKVLSVLAAVVLLSTSVLGQPAEPSAGPAGIFSAEPFQTVEGFVEKLEVGLAGVIGGPDLKAKALANNAEESLEEAERLAERNRSGKAAERIQTYEKKMNRSQNILEKTGNRNLSEEIQNISSRNVQRLEEVKEKVPEEAQKGIEKAIENSRRRERPENPQMKPETSSNSGMSPGPENPGENISARDRKDRAEEARGNRTNKSTSLAKDVEKPDRPANNTDEEIREGEEAVENTDKTVEKAPRDSGGESQSGSNPEKPSDLTGGTAGP
jgi:hypothetical protein